MARALSEEPEFASNIDLDLPPDSFAGLEVPAPNVTLTAAPAPAPACGRAGSGTKRGLGACATGWRRSAGKHQ